MCQEKTRMICNCGINVYIFPFIIFNVAIMVQGQCDAAVLSLEGTDGTIESPNFGYEFGKKSTCSWKIKLPTDQFVVLHIDDLQLHFTNSEGRLNCMPSYVLKINEERIGCDPPRLTESHFPSTAFCMQFQNPLCQSTQLCPIVTSIDDPVEISYDSDGATPPAMSSPHLTGFRIRYMIYSCQQAETKSHALVPSVETTQPQQPSTISTDKPNVATVEMAASDISTVTSTVATLTKDSKATRPTTHGATLTNAGVTECSEQPESRTVSKQQQSRTISPQTSQKAIYQPTSKDTSQPTETVSEQLTSWTVAVALGAALGLVLFCVAVYIIRKALFSPIVLNANGRRRHNGAANIVAVKYTANGGENEERNDVEVGPEQHDRVIDGRNGLGVRNPAFENGVEGREPTRRLAHASGDLISQERSLSNGMPHQSIEVNGAGMSRADRITKAVTSVRAAMSHSTDEAPPPYRNGPFIGIVSASASPTPSVTYSNAETIPYDDRSSLLSLRVQPFSRGASMRRHSEGESPAPSVTYSNAETVPYEEDQRSLSSACGGNGDQEPARNCRRRRSNSIGRRHSETEVKCPA